MKLRDTLDMMKKSTRVAFDDMRSAFGNERDRDVMFYETLTPEEYNALANKFGMDALADYVLSMEKRRMGRGG